MIGIHPRQKQALDFIAGYIREHGRSPDLSEIAAALGIKYRSGACNLVGRLERLGCLRRRRACARGIEVTATVRGERFRFIPKTRATGQPPVDLGIFAAGIPQNRSSHHRIIGDD